MTYTANVKVEFGISFEVNADTEEQAQTKIEHLLEIIEQEGTLDCHLASEYDVCVDCVDAKLKCISNSN